MDAMPPSTLSDLWLQKLADSGYRITPPMRALVAILAESRRALGPVELYDLGRRQHPRLGLVTVYRTLEKLEELGLVQRIHQANGCHGYLRAAEGHTHILLCTTCGRVAYFQGDDLSALIDSVARQSGFAITEHWLQLHGLCEDCK